MVDVDVRSWIDNALLLAVLIVLGMSSLAQLAYELLGWPRWLVRHFDRRKQVEVRRLLDEIGFGAEQRRLLREKETEALIARAATETDPRRRALQLLKSCTHRGNYLVGGYSERFDYFVDVASAALDPRFAESCAAVLASHLRRANSSGFDRVVGIKEGTPQIAIAFGERVRKPVSLFRGREEKFAGSSERENFRHFDGGLRSGEEVIIVDDSTTGGRKVLDCIKRLQEAGCRVGTCLVLFEPLGKDARSKLREAGVELQSVLTMTPDVVRELRS